MSHTLRFSGVDATITLFAVCFSRRSSDVAADTCANTEPPDRDFLVCALDLLSGLVEGMGQSLEPLIGASELPALLLACMRQHAPDVRQSAFALVGDLAKVSGMA